MSPSSDVRPEIQDAGAHRGFRGGWAAERSLAVVEERPGDACVTYVTCELACYVEQVEPDDGGRPFELLLSANDEGWARRVASAVGGLSFDAALGIRGRTYGILRVLGITREEMAWAYEHSGEKLVKRLKAAGVYPHSDVHRASVPP